MTGIYVALLATAFALVGGLIHYSRPCELTPHEKLMQCRKQSR